MANQLALKGGPPVRTKPFSPWPILGDEERKLLLAVFDSGNWSFGGPKEAEFSQKFAEFSGAKHAFCVANGSVSLEIALRALGIGPGDEVLVPALTWHATAWAVVQVGATPVFVDVREADWCLDPADARAKLSPRTRALIPVHLYSQIAEMDELLAIACERKLVILEDCAHMHGGRWGDRGAGVIGDIGSFSFQQSKGMTSGEGGVLTTDNEELAHRIYGFKNCGRPWKDGRFGFGGNYRITEFQAAVLLPQLARLPEQLKTKSANAALLREKLAKVPGIQTTARKAKVTREGMYGFQVRFDPDKFAGMPQEIFINALKAEGIPAQAPYSAVYQSPLWTSGEKLLKFAPGENAAQRLCLNAECPVAERLSGEEGVVLLHHLFLGDAADMDDIAAAFAKVQQNAGELRMDILEKKAKRVARSFLKKVGFGS
jgi:L-glutamine:2-deoxy-scyllo-inosose/3-amino-2,3-dideoxy-scyllo-inosose aminotransferase